ncbi:GP88 family protein [Actinoplanes sp. RD1]|uniref:GP88 family protein n=1 Tax=Actinoplanes sp. RD1 TaxID=3064538 RepID=UPI00274191D9|nr:hypothetical protein [Actinoplanes sp. RD1]
MPAALSHHHHPAAIELLHVRPRQLLTQNSRLRRDRIYNWTLPAWAGRLPDGRTYNTCPSAGICAKVCYARAGAYRFSNVLARHERNLAYVLDDLVGWTAQMIAEINRKRVGTIVRIHDGGDFFADAYLTAWLTVMTHCSSSRFYTYTKEVNRFRRLVEPRALRNFKWVYSYGGIQDIRLNPARDRVADVFPTAADIVAARYHDQSASDLLAVDGPSPVGMAANNIPHFLKRQGDRTFRTWQAETNALFSRRRRQPASGQ